MNTKSDMLMTIVTAYGSVTLQQVIDNLKVLKTNKGKVRMEYTITRINSDIPWPAPYQAGETIDGKNFHCCSYSTVDSESDIEDTKILNVYRTSMNEE